MSKSEFDKFAEQYDSVMGESIPDALNDDTYFAEYKVALVSKLLETKKSPQRILDYGCGSGRSLHYLAEYFPESAIIGYDISEASLKIASEKVPRATVTSDWETSASPHYDLMFTANVFHHIPPEFRLHAMQKCRDALAPDGRFFLFEHNPYNPVTRWIFERCPFDIDAQMLTLSESIRLAEQAGLSVVKHGYTLFFPKTLALLRPIEPLLRRVPLGAQYYVEMAK